ncbi:C4-dicarboxylate transporter, DctM subunit [Desulfuromusa kysingii]|uniref:C4-dicarboxylate transporter, DctM subunit n=1 Tax=Desulfuromusa kysingii TaxID=37625 RepID=A0A1H3YBG4_9BACT|nr:TRAP transporter large permease [Desulfuromusa kysingii]SEA08883.1 C4-dicarboxylate transporter, DctM subunit [Desulfuromusa kysingii]
MQIVLIFLAVFMGLAIIRVPIPFSAAAAGIVGMLWGGVPLGIIPSAIYNSLDSFAFLAIPAFICAGDIMSIGGITTALVSFVRSIFGPIKGSVGATTIIASMLFGTISGSSIATVSGIGGMMIPEMCRAGYKKEYAVSLVAASGFLGILIPPSIPGLVYALSSGLSVADVWIATAVPGLLLTLAFVLYNRIFFAKYEISDVQEGETSDYWGKIISRVPRGMVSLLMPIIIFGGVYGGVLTPTEAGAVAVGYGLIAGWLIFPILFKEKPTGALVSVFRKSGVTSSTICLLIAFAAIPSAMFIYSNTVAQVTDFLLGLTDSPVVFLIIANIIMLLVGMFMETNTSILLLAPILVPAAKAYGVDPIHFGAIMLLNLEIGMITPPFSANVFVSCRIGDMTLDKVLKHVFGFILICLPVLLLTTYFPAISLTVVEMFK